MLATYLVGITLTVAVSLLWVGVQHAWREAFVDRHAPPLDALAGRCRCDHAACGIPHRPSQPKEHR